VKHSHALEALKASAKNENDELKHTIIRLHEEKLEEIEVFIKNIYKQDLSDIKKDMQKLENLMRQSHRILKQEIQTPWWRRIIMKMKGEE